MVALDHHLSWRRIGRGVAIVYGISFLSGLGLTFAGITPQTDRVLYPLLALLTGGLGVAVALQIVDTTRLSYLLALGVGVWLTNFSSVLLGTQPVLGWVESSLFIAMTVLLGRLLLGIRLAPSSTLSLSRVDNKIRPTVQQH